MSGHIHVTTPSGSRRHLSVSGSGYTLCHFTAVGPGPRTRRSTLTQRGIDALPLCQECKKAAMTPPAFEPRELVITVPWATWVAAKRIAKKRGLGLREHVLGLIDADNAADTDPIHAQITDEVNELRAQWGTR